MVKNLLKSGVIVIFMLVIGIIIIDGPLKTVTENTPAVMIIIPLALCMGLMAFAKKMFEKHEERLKKEFDAVLIIYLALTFVLQTLFIDKLRFTPAWDLDAVYGGAISWINNGELGDYKAYFLGFKNNFGMLAVYRTVFSVFHLIFGDKTDYFLIAATMACLSISVTRYAVVKICKKLFGTVSAYLAMVLMLICPVMYVWGAAFYTDVMSLWAAPVTMLLFIKARECRQEEEKSTDKSSSDKKALFKKPVIGKILLYTASAVTAALGAEIKFTVLIIVIALGLSLLINGDFKELAMFGGIQIAVFAIAFGCLNALYYSNIDKAEADANNVPIIHWIMMGASENGAYNGADYEFTYSFSDKEEREQAIKEELVSRYKNYGTEGSMKLWKRKTNRDFGDGTLGISDFLDDNVAKPSSLHEYLLYDGEHYEKWFALCGDYLLLLFAMSLVSVVKFMKEKDIPPLRESITLTVYMCMIGVWLFLMFWEASARYFSNFFGVIILGAMLGFGAFCREKEVPAVKKKKRR